jgi:hypothetical protein
VFEIGSANGRLRVVEWFFDTPVRVKKQGSSQKDRDKPKRQEPKRQGQSIQRKKKGTEHSVKIQKLIKHQVIDN